MIANSKIARFLLIVLILLFAIEGYGKEANVQIETKAVQENNSNLSGDSATSDPDSQAEKSSKSSLFFPIDELHAVIREERIESFVEIDKQRKETLDYLTQERNAILDEMRSELKRITELITSERTTTMVELQEIGNLIAENAIFNSKQLIDHLFIRILQFTAVMITSIVILALISYGIVVKRKKHT